MECPEMSGFVRSGGELKKRSQTGVKVRVGFGLYFSSWWCWTLHGGGLSDEVARSCGAGTERLPQIAAITRKATLHG
jgi:hypothetical protein